MTFQQELRDLINRYSEENVSDTPDWILAAYLQDCLNTFNCAVNAREEWYGRDNKTPASVDKPFSFGEQIREGQRAAEPPA